LVLKGLLERLGVGGPKVGLDQQTNTLKYMAVMVGPFYGLLFLNMYLQSIGVRQDYLMMILSMGFVTWIAGVYGIHSHMTKEACEYLVFDQAKWRFDENTAATVDVFIPKDGIQYIG